MKFLEWPTAPAHFFGFSGHQKTGSSHITPGRYRGPKNEKGQGDISSAFFRDPAGIRTQDPYIKSVMLYQLSYGINFPDFFPFLLQVTIGRVTESCQFWGYSRN
jgi:hypothetical protein